MKIILRKRVGISAALVLGVIIAVLPFIIIFSMGQEKKAVQITEETAAFVCRTYLAQKADPLNAISSFNSPKMLTKGLLEKAVENALSEEPELTQKIRRERKVDYSFGKRIEARVNDTCGAEKSFTTLFLKEADSFSAQNIW